MTLQLRRGTTTARMTETLVAGQPYWDETQNLLYIGDGSTAGGLASAHLPAPPEDNRLYALHTGGTTTDPVGVPNTFVTDNFSNAESIITAFNDHTIALERKDLSTNPSQATVDSWFPIGTQVTVPVNRLRLENGDPWTTGEVSFLVTGPIALAQYAGATLLIPAARIQGFGGAHFRVGVLNRIDTTASPVSQHWEDVTDAVHNAANGYSEPSAFPANPFNGQLINLQANLTGLPAGLVANESAPAATTITTGVQFDTYRYSGARSRWLRVGS